MAGKGTAITFLPFLLFFWIDKIELVVEFPVNFPMLDFYSKKKERKIHQINFSRLKKKYPCKNSHIFHRTTPIVLNSIFPRRWCVTASSNQSEAKSTQQQSSTPHPASKLLNVFTPKAKQKKTSTASTKFSDATCCRAVNMEGKWKKGRKKSTLFMLMVANVISHVNRKISALCYLYLVWWVVALPLEKG